MRAPVGRSVGRCGEQLSLHGPALRVSYCARAVPVFVRRPGRSAVDSPGQVRINGRVFRPSPVHNREPSGRNGDRFITRRTAVRCHRLLPAAKGLGAGRKDASETARVRRTTLCEYAAELVLSSAIVTSLLPTRCDAAAEQGRRTIIIAIAALVCLNAGRQPSLSTLYSCHSNKLRPRVTFDYIRQLNVTRPVRFRRVYRLVHRVSSRLLNN